MEGKYAGIFKPSIHYIEIKSDFSNINEVFSLIQNKDYCQNIAENAYRDVVLSGKYTYRQFANMVVEHIVENRSPAEDDSFWAKGYYRVLGEYLKFREWMEPVLVKLFYPWLAIKLYRFGVFRQIRKKISQ
jgi:hypothetical protein